MKVLWFLPLTYVADVQGFTFFAPYAGLIFAVLCLMQSRRRNRPAALATAS